VRRLAIGIGVLLALSGCKRSQPVPDAAPAPTPESWRTFEGQMVTHVYFAQLGRPDLTMAVHVKPPMMRIDNPPGFPDSDGYSFENTQEKRITYVRNGTKQYFSRPLPDVIAGLHRGERVDRGVEPHFRKTGEKETVAGVPCEVWDLVSQKGHRIRACVADAEVPWLDVPPNRAFLPNEAWTKELTDGHHMMMRSTSYDRTGADVVSIEIEKIERKSQPDSLFQIPAGYERIDDPDAPPVAPAPSAP
jgi:hypothetical protein